MAQRNPTLWADDPPPQTPAPDSGPVVPSCGPQPADVLILGPSPGKEEIVALTPREGHSGANEVITLRGGVRVSCAALRVVWRFEDTGIMLRRRGSTVRAEPAAFLTDGDRLALSQHERELSLLVRYCDRVDALTGMTTAATGDTRS